ncbi:FmdB family zinc ribbon protein [Hydrogenophaga sp. PAMC20947]|uniref:FmdB family zinc ribbon protein n=1 Tax=Hydrogenophaga sp. PAMC20947 TaxID=2565558 RepID=UPI00109E0C1C|nr:FmdB family zinc ribbon protein [Hydrogenophaga sp. PAMC20947]QCB46667.1 zinc ribbon domain-containing protein [Hydrogenophaga sp. PAMC20947]
MPIYAYKCASCGHAKDVLQRMSDDQLTVCPACGEASFQKQVTAAGFQLKGSGWYVTDFRGGSKGEPAAAPAAGGAETTAAPASVPASGSPAPSVAAPAAATPSPAPAPKPTTSGGGSSSH